MNSSESVNKNDSTIPGLLSFDMLVLENFSVCLGVQVDLLSERLFIVSTLLFVGLWIADNGRQGEQITPKWLKLEI